MSNTLSIPKKKLINFSSLEELIADLFTSELDRKNEKKKPLKLTNSHIKALVDMPISAKLTSEQRQSLSKLLIESDVELKVLVSLMVASAKCRHSEVRKEILGFAIHTVNNITFLNPMEDANIFLLRDISEGNSGYLARLINQLRNRFEKYQGKNLKPAQKRHLESNILAIAHIWAFENGKADIDKTLDSFSRLLITLRPDEAEKSVNIEVDTLAATSMVYFLASQTTSTLLKDFSLILSFFKAKQDVAQSESSRSKRESLDLQENYKKLETQTDILKAESFKKDELIKQLADEILSLKEQQVESHQSIAAQKVHLKDDTSKAKAKALNFLEEEVLPNLENSYKALDRENPKLHVALHNLDVMIERVEEELKWFRK
ncbi:hypothetical protein [Vibrio sp. B1Z05]|uniref:hypothetical protein n=1 Tax=Vibrio sp. B1Z05 TaxID=2654980 RepID=UPI00128D1100|nr:hypothetical protein [Vibrio sp. B1Z05]MPW37476.1 hypothetical protein [Vibrio sp. B1Z05]